LGMPLIRYFSVFFLCMHLSVLGQSKQAGDSLSSAERIFLDLILRDSTSTTICRLPKGMNFGMPNPDTGRMVLVKEGKINQILLEGTNRVYVPDSTRKKGLIRIDSTYYTGDNFNFMAFRRRDTLYQYGGYGFWDTRDFFTWYRAWNHEWEIEVQTDYLQQQWTAYQYDPKLDALLTMGRRYRGPFDDDEQYVDSVYRFDFRDKKWAAMGRIEAHLPWSNRPVQPSDLIAHTPFGLLFRSAQGYVLADLIHNQRSTPDEALAGRLMALTQPDNIQSDKNAVYLYLRDTLYLIDNKTGMAHVRSTVIRQQDFQSDNAHRYIFSTGTNNLKWPLIIVGILGLFVLVRLKLARRKNEPKNLRKQETEVLSGNLSQEILPSVVPIDPASREGTIHEKSPNDRLDVNKLIDFMSHLNEVERALITSIVKSTIEDQKLDIQRINDIIGVSQKPMAIQKARRSLVIHQINRKFTLAMGSTIDSKRTRHVQKKNLCLFIRR
jgi:hypothetical protein